MLVDLLPRVTDPELLKLALVALAILAARI
jgi:hypothetical protein